MRTTTVTRKRFFVPALCLAWLVAGKAIALGNDSPQPTSFFNHKGESITPANEITVAGTVQKMVSTHTQGAPAGVHILLATTQEIVDACLGPYLTNHVRLSLTNGQAVQVVGVFRVSGDQNYLIARQLILAGQQITIRNGYGFLLRARSVARSQSRPSRTNADGGVQ